MTCAQKPAWIRRGLNSESPKEIRRLLERLDLNTVCSEARCPNLGECYSRKRATFLIAGKICSRRCLFCSVEKGTPGPLDPEEPRKIAEAIEKMKLRHIVITSVTRDDLEDGAAGHFARTIRAVRKSAGDLSVEVLTPDFLGRHALIDTVLNERPDVFNHNIETVKRLSRDIRPQADYERSLGVLCYAAENYPEVKTKSGLMVGLGEREDEVMETLRDLRGAGVQMVTIGQYLRPSAGCLPVAEFVTPEKFEYYGREARALGFEEVASGPFVRSSYNAEESFIRVST